MVWLQRTEEIGEPSPSPSFRFSPTVNDGRVEGHTRALTVLQNSILRRIEVRNLLAQKTKEWALVDSPRGRLPHLLPNTFLTTMPETLSDDTTKNTIVVDQAAVSDSGDEDTGFLDSHAAPEYLTKKQRLSAYFTIAAAGFGMIR